MPILTAGVDSPVSATYSISHKQGMLGLSDWLFRLRELQPVRTNPERLYAPKSGGTSPFGNFFSWFGDLTCAHWKEFVR